MLRAHVAANGRYAVQSQVEPEQPAVVGPEIHRRQAGGERETSVHEDGAFAFDDLLTGDATFSAVAEGYLESTPLPLVLLDGEPLVEIPIVLRRGAVLRVDLDPTWLEPTEQVATIVPLAATGGAVERPIEGRRVTQPFDSGASTRFDGLRPGAWKVEVRPRGGASIAQGSRLPCSTKRCSRSRDASAKSTRQSTPITSAPQLRISPNRCAALRAR